MAQKIQVPKGFKEDFEFYVRRAGFDAQETEIMREAVRDNFDEMGPFVVSQAACYRFIDRVFGGKTPTPDQCRAFIEGEGWEIGDESIFKRWGIRLQVQLCAELAGEFANLSMKPRSLIAASA